MQSSDLAYALTSFRQGNIAEAEKCLRIFIGQKFDLEIDNLKIRKDTFSLNSVNGIFDTSDGQKLFFKFHMEESEETVQEYYRAELLAQAGYPVEAPLYISREPGEQILIYPYKDSERLADLCRRLEKPEHEDSKEFQDLIKAQEELDTICATKCLETFKTATPKELEQEPLLQLFYWRLVNVQEDGTHKPGGRHHSYYVGQDFQFPDDITLPYEKLANMQWKVNGLSYPVTLEDAFQKSRKMLAPDYYKTYAACTTHGDAHNGNVWANKTEDGGTYLSWFDPAFAGENIPVLLNEVKALFHNIYAHPDWLYDSKDADAMINASCTVEGNILVVDHDWVMPILRKAFLDSKLHNFWIPVLKDLKNKDLLPDDWEEYVRAALFCCPTLVMNLRAGSGTAQNIHTPKTSLLGLSISIMLACAPSNGSDYLSEFFANIKSALLKE